MVAEPDTTSGGVGCTHVLNAPSTISYFRSQLVDLLSREDRASACRTCCDRRLAERRHPVGLIERPSASGVELTRSAVMKLDGVPP
jgi:hypothetical protein